MKKVLSVMALSATLICCNTPQPTTTGTGITTDSVGTGSTNMNQSTTTDPSTTTPTDTSSTRPTDSLSRQPLQ